MIIFPAIDIQNGECVRLTKGDFATAERVAEDPVQTALAFQETGAQWLHMVDLDGARDGQMQNRDTFIRVARETELKIELGGGIREMKTAAYYLENGIERIILGSIAVKNPKLVAEMVREYGDRIIVGIDAENGMVKIDGWLGAGRVNFLTLAREMAYIGVRHIIYTDISRDGTLTGPNLEDLKKLQERSGVNVIASGGISSIADIQALADLRLYGAICGKSLYRKTLSLKEALEVGNASVPLEPREDVLEPEDSRVGQNKNAQRGGKPKSGETRSRAEGSGESAPSRFGGRGPVQSRSQNGRNESRGKDGREGKDGAKNSSRPDSRGNASRQGKPPRKDPAQKNRPRQGPAKRQGNAGAKGPGKPQKPGENS